MIKTILSFKSALYLMLLYTVSNSSVYSQMEVGSIWKATGNLESALHNSGVDSTKMQFLGGGMFQLTYESGAGPQTETSLWADVSATEFKFFYDPTGMVFGALCPDDSTFVQYTINGNQLTMNTVTGSCTTANGILTGSIWNKVGGSSAGITETESGIRTLYPNPSNGEVYLTLNHGVELTDLQLTTLLGQAVPFTVSQTGKNTVVIRLIGVEKGIYYLGTGSTKLETIILQ